MPASCSQNSICMQGSSCSMESGVKHFHAEVSMPGNFNPLNLVAECLLASSEGDGNCTGVLRKCQFQPRGFHCGRWEQSGLCLTFRMTYSSVLQEIPWQAAPARGWEWQRQPKGRRAIERWGREHTATAWRVTEHEVCFMSLCQNYLPMGWLSPDIQILQLCRGQPTLNPQVGEVKRE